jgi:hypothetical protein
VASFASTISNEDVAQLEPVRFDGRIVVVETVRDLLRACEVLSAQKIIGFDTETRPSFTSGMMNKVALLQLSTDDVCFLIRLNKVPLDKALIAILQNENIAKVGAAVQNDIAALNALRRFKARGFIDLQNEVGRFGIEDRSLRKLSGIIIGKKVSKAQRLSNWEAQTLTPQQQQYAATDAWVCIELLRRLQAAENGKTKRP